MTEPFTLRWGIIGTGLIASWFVSDLVRDPAEHRNEHNLKHVVAAIASSSSIDKATAFADQYLTPAGVKPRLYSSYEEIYNDPDVDIVYIATPSSLHMKNAMDSINAGKHVLCEKPMALNAKGAVALVAAAKEKRVFLMEAVWTRFSPLIEEFKRLVHVEKAIGRVTRVIFDFGLDMPLEKQPKGSRLADLSLGAGSLLDIGIYCLTWASLTLHESPRAGKRGSEEPPLILSTMMLNKGVDEMTTVVMSYQKHRVQAICTASYLHKSEFEFGRVEGTNGSIILRGIATSKPLSLILKRNNEPDKALDFSFEGRGFFYEADAVARDVREGRTENETLPLEETLRILAIMDEVRQQNGLKYPVEDE